MNSWTCRTGEAEIVANVCEQLEEIAPELDKNIQMHALSLDIAGQFSPGQDQDQGHLKYFIMAIITVPFKDERPLVWGWRPESSSQDEEQAAEDTLQELQPRLEEGVVGNPFKGDDGAVITEEEINKCTLKQEIENLKSTNVKHLTLAAPLLNRKEQTVLTAVAKLYARIKVLQIPVLSVKRDRAKEFVSKRFREWVANRDILQNFTAGDEPTGNTRAEIEIGILCAIEVSGTPDG